MEQKAKGLSNDELCALAHYLHARADAVHQAGLHHAQALHDAANLINGPISEGRHEGGFLGDIGDAAGSLASSAGNFAGHLASGTGQAVHDFFSLAGIHRPGGKLGDDDIGMLGMPRPHGSHHGNGTPMAVTPTPTAWGARRPDRHEGGFFGSLGNAIGDVTSGSGRALDNMFALAGLKQDQSASDHLHARGNAVYADALHHAMHLHHVADGLLEKAGQPPRYEGGIFGGIGNAIGDVAGGVGNAVGSVTSGVGNTLDRIF